MKMVICYPGKGPRRIEITVMQGLNSTPGITYGPFSNISALPACRFDRFSIPRPIFTIINSEPLNTLLQLKALFWEQRVCRSILMTDESANGIVKTRLRANLGLQVEIGRSGTGTVTETEIDTMIESDTNPQVDMMTDMEASHRTETEIVSAAETGEVQAPQGLETQGKVLHPVELASLIMMRLPLQV